MKKIVLFLAVIFSVLFVNAQSPRSVVSWAALSTTDTQITYLVITGAYPITMNYPVTLTVIPVNTSGTATVTAQPQGSLDGTNWFDIEAAATVNNAGTVALKAFVYPNAYFRYYRIKLVSSGTGVTAFTGSLGLK